MCFPTDAHKQAAETMVEFFRAQPGVEAVLLVNSLARGQAVPDSDLDAAVLIAPDMPLADRDALERKWQALYAAGEAFRRLKQAGRFCGVHLDLFDGRFVPERWDDGGGPDDFEIEIGNRVAHSLPLWEAGSAFAELKAAWLPYYAEPLCRERLAMVRAACAYDIEHIPFFVGRGLYFQAFDRLYKAFREFLQALFIARRTYPIAYNKWIREQVEEWLGLPELYAQLPPILQITRLESDEILDNARLLQKALTAWTAPLPTPRP